MDWIIASKVFAFFTGCLLLSFVVVGLMFKLHAYVRVRRGDDAAGSAVFFCACLLAFAVISLAVGAGSAK